jgi:hypothetical protein
MWIHMGGLHTESLFCYEKLRLHWPYQACLLDLLENEISFLKSSILCAHSPVRPTHHVLRHHNSSLKCIGGQVLNSGTNHLPYIHNMISCHPEEALEQGCGWEKNQRNFESSSLHIVPHSPQGLSPYFQGVDTILFSPP